MHAGPHVLSIYVELIYRIMFCPSCAAENAAEMKFCRSCGQDLTGVSQALSGSGTVALASRIDSELKEYKQRRAEPRITRAAYFGVIGLFFTVFWFILYFTFSGVGLAQAPLLLVSLMFIGFGIKEYVKYKRSRSLQTHNGDELPSPARVPGSNPNLIGDAPASVWDVRSSVTETTTRDLDPIKRDDKDQAGQ